MSEATNYAGILRNIAIGQPVLFIGFMTLFTSLLHL